MGKTVTTYLLESDPKGTQYVFISNSLCKMYIVNRSNLSILNDREELQKPAFYILLGEDEDLNPKAYIGETESFKERVKDHDSKKFFWQRALVFVSKDEDITKSDVKYLEYLAIKEAKENKDYLLTDNKQTPNLPNLPEYQQDAMDEFFDDIKFLTSFSGCTIFDKVEHKKQHLFYHEVSGKCERVCNAKGIYTSAGFTVLKGSKIAKQAVKSLQWNEKREALLKELCTEKSDYYILNVDKTFSSPSTAVSFCNGRSSNGWVEWKDKDNQTLDSVYRKQID